MFYYDWSIVILIPALILSAIAQMKVKSTFNKYLSIGSRNGYSGAEVARILLDSNGLFHVPIEIVRGKLTDHYDPTKKVMRLSREVYEGSSVASIGVAAHETGHAIQHSKKYAPLIFRNSIVPVVNFGSRASWILLLLGFIMSIPQLISFGIILFGGVVLFQLVTLPVEFDASRRALRVLEEKTILYDNELKSAKSVLNAAALTYVASALVAISQLIRLILISRDR